MKNLLFPIAMLVMIAFASCKKNYTCTCTSKEISSGATATSIITVNGSRQDAQDACAQQGNAHSSANPGHGIVTCEVE